MLGNVRLDATTVDGGSKNVVRERSVDLSLMFCFQDTCAKCLHASATLFSLPRVTVSVSGLFCRCFVGVKRWSSITFVHLDGWSRVC